MTWSAVGEHALDLDTLTRELGCHPLEVLDEGLLAVAHARVVLALLRPGVAFDRLRRSVLVEHQVVEVDDVLLVSRGDRFGHLGDNTATAHFMPV